MSSSESDHHPQEYPLAHPSVVEVSRAGPPSSCSEEEDVPFRVPQDSQQNGGPQYLDLPPPPSSSIDMAGPSGIASTMMREDALQLKGVQGSRTLSGSRPQTQESVSS